MARTITAPASPSEESHFRLNDTIHYQLLKVYHTVEGGGGSVIDMYERASVTVADRTFPLSSIVESQD